MRFLTFAICIVASLSVLFLSVPRFVSSALHAPGFQAVQLALSGENIRPESYDRALRSLENALAWSETRQRLVELAIVHKNIADQSNDLRERQELHSASLAAAEASFRYSPVQPIAALLMAQIHYDNGRYDEAAKAFDWAMRTGHYLGHQARARTLLGVALWDLLAEETRARLMASLSDTLARDLELVAEIAAEAAVDAAIIDRLDEIEPGGLVLAAQFGAAVRRYRHAQTTETAALGEPAAMRRLIAASSLLVTASLPNFAEAMTVEQYLEITRGENPDRPPESVDEYLVGVLDALIVLGDFNAREGTPLFCVPPQEVMNIDVTEFRVTLDAMLAQYEQEVPDFDTLAQTRSVGLAALQLLSTLHPCDA